MYKRESIRRNTGLSAITETFVQYEAYLKAFLRRFMQRQNDIEDIAQEAYLRAFKLEQNSHVEHPKTLLFTIAKNVALNELRNKAKRVTECIEECQNEPEFMTSTTEETVEALDKLETYCAAVDALPEQCRRVYLLRKVHGLPHKDIAEKLDITVRSVERHMQKGVIKCRAYMREQEKVDLKADSQASVGSLPKQGVE